MRKSHIYPVGNEPFVRPPTRFVATGSEAKIGSTNSFAVISTSGLNAAKLALDLSRASISAKPKLFIIDNEPKVALFWSTMQRVAFASSSPDELLTKLRESTAAMLRDVFDGDDRQLNDKLGDNGEVIRPGLASYLAQMIAEHGFERVRQVIVEADIKLGSWCDEALMEDTKTYCDSLGIKQRIAYPTNILSTIAQSRLSSVGREDVMFNARIDGRGMASRARRDCESFIIALQALRPDLTCMTNMSASLLPSTAFWFDGAGPESLADYSATVFANEYQYRGRGHTIDLTSAAEKELSHQPCRARLFGPPLAETKVSLSEQIVAVASMIWRH